MIQRLFEASKQDQKNTGLKVETNSFETETLNNQMLEKILMCCFFLHENIYPSVMNLTDSSAVTFKPFEDVF